MDSYPRRGGDWVRRVDRPYRSRSSVHLSIQTHGWTSCYFYIYYTRCTSPKNGYKPSFSIKINHVSPAVGEILSKHLVQVWKSDTTHTSLNLKVVFHKQTHVKNLRHITFEARLHANTQALIEVIWGLS